MKLKFEYESRALIFYDGETYVKRNPNRDWEKLFGETWEPQYFDDDYEAEYQKLKTSKKCPDIDK